MINGRNIIAIIPARGGSKRLPGKNLKDLCGKPMIEWTIDESKKSKYIDKIVVSTEDKAIVQAVANKGVEIVDRPEALAGDRSSVYDAIFHALEQFEKFDYVVLLQVTSPLRLVTDIDACIEECIRRNAPACISICEGRPDANGAVYVAWTSWLRETRLFDTGRVVTLVMPESRSVDVDRMEDFQNAERLMSQRLSYPSAGGHKNSTHLKLLRGNYDLPQRPCDTET